MKNIIIVWILPAVRQLGGPLPVEEILNAEIEMSADAGGSFSSVGSFPTSQLSVPVADLPISNQYVVRGRAIDTDNQPGNWFAQAFSIVDDSPPGDLVVGITIQ